MNVLDKIKAYKLEHVAACKASVPTAEVEARAKDRSPPQSVPFFKNNEAKIIDPLDAKKLQEDLDEKITAFEAEVDVALSESNARTDITLN